MSRLHALGCAAVGAMLALTPAAHAQEPPWGQWVAGPAEFLEFGAWVTELDASGSTGNVTVLCAADRPYLNVAWLQGEMAQQEGQMQITVDGRPMWLNARYLYYTAEPGWAVQLLPDVTQALRSGSAFTVRVAGRGPTTFRLNGSAAAIDAALAGCGSGAGYHADWTDYFTFVARDATGTMRPVDRLPGPGETFESMTGATVATPPAPAPHLAPAPPPAADPAPEADAVPATPISVVDVQAAALAECPSGPQFGPETFVATDLDGDAQWDLLVNWSQIQCPGATTFGMTNGLGRCGMHNCSVDIYLSSRYSPGDYPVPFLNHMGVAPEIRQEAGQWVLRTFYQGGSCPFAHVCMASWRWDGTELVATDEGPMTQ